MLTETPSPTPTHPIISVNIVLPLFLSIENDSRFKRQPFVVNILGGGLFYTQFLGDMTLSQHALIIWLALKGARV